jgi:hypothetical protein
MDDIFFVDDNNGWVVGEGIFRTAPALRTQTDTIFSFRFVCPDSTARDTVRFRNVNWFTSPWTATITGADAAMFSISNGPIPATIGSCANQDVIVTYRPTTRSAHSAMLSTARYHTVRSARRTAIRTDGKSGGHAGDVHSAGRAAP